MKDGGGNAELEVGDYMTHVTADIIACTAFGSNYEKERKCLKNKLHSSTLRIKEINNDLMQYQDTSSFPIILVSFRESLLFMIDLIWRRMLCLIALFSSWFYGFECSSLVTSTY